jgi:tetratricopeptide (TPR) repeat protein
MTKRRRAAAASPPPAREKRASGLRRHAVVVCTALLLAAGCWVYSSSFAGVLVFDDVASITSNPHIKSLWPLTGAASAPRDTTMAGRPVAALTLALNYALAPADARDALTTPGPGSSTQDREAFLRNVWGYHALNLVVHLLAGLALFGVARRSLLAPAIGGRFGRSATPLAFLVALIWIVHPLHTEAVTYVVQRVESLMGLFYLVTLYGAIRAAEPGGRRRWWAGASIAACALGMGTKEAMITAPVMVVLWDVLIGTDRRGRWPLYAGLASTWLILAALVAGNPRPGSVGFGLGGWTWWSYLQTQAAVVAHYLRLAIVPAPLVFDYEWPRAASLADIALPALLLATLLALTVAAVLRRHPAGFAGAWFFVILAPTSSILPIPTEVAAEHRMYLPLAAVVALAVLALHSLVQRVLTSRSAAGTAKWRPADLATLIAGLAVAALLGTTTHARNLDYHSDEALMRDTVEKRPFNIRARVAYGADLLAERRFADAEAQLRTAARLPGSDKAHAQAEMHLGSALCAQGKLDEGIAHLRQALALDPSLAEAHALLGEAFSGLGQSELAGRHFTLAADGLPDNAAVLRRVAWQLATAPDARFRDGRKALDLAERAVRLTARRDLLALEALMAALAAQGRFGDAAAAGREALALARAQGNDLFVRALQGEIAACEAGRSIR